MRKRQWKKILSLVLALAMVFTMNTSVFAAANTEVSTPNAESTVQPEDTETPAAEAETPAETPAAEEPATETPAAEEPAAEAPAEETPAQPVESNDNNEQAAGEALAAGTWLVKKEGGTEDATSNEANYSDNSLTIKANVVLVANGNASGDATLIIKDNSEDNALNVTLKGEKDKYGKITIPAATAANVTLDNSTGLAVDTTEGHELKKTELTAGHTYIVGYIGGEATSAIAASEEGKIDVETATLPTGYKFYKEDLTELKSIAEIESAIPQGGELVLYEVKNDGTAIAKVKVNKETTVPAAFDAEKLNVGATRLTIAKDDKNATDEIQVLDSEGEVVAKEEAADAAVNILGLKKNTTYKVRRRTASSNEGGKFASNWSEETEFKTTEIEKAGDGDTITTDSWFELAENETVTVSGMVITNRTADQKVVGRAISNNENDGIFTVTLSEGSAAAKLTTTTNGGNKSVSFDGAEGTGYIIEQSTAAIDGTKVSFKGDITVSYNEAGNDDIFDVESTVKLSANETGYALLVSGNTIKHSIAGKDEPVTGMSGKVKVWVAAEDSGDTVFNKDLAKGILTVVDANKFILSENKTCKVGAGNYDLTKSQSGWAFNYGSVVFYGDDATMASPKFYQIPERYENGFTGQLTNTNFADGYAIKANGVSFGLMKWPENVKKDIDSYQFTLSTNGNATYGELVSGEWEYADNDMLDTVSNNTDVKAGTQYYIYARRLGAGTQKYASEIKNIGSFTTLAKPELTFAVKSGAVSPNYIGDAKTEKGKFKNGVKSVVDSLFDYSFTAGSTGVTLVADDDETDNVAYIVNNSDGLKIGEIVVYFSKGEKAELADSDNIGNVTGTTIEIEPEKLDANTGAGQLYYARADYKPYTGAGYSYSTINAVSSNIVSFNVVPAPVKVEPDVTSPAVSGNIGERTYKIYNAITGTKLSKSLFSGDADYYIDGKKADSESWNGVKGLKAGTYKITVSAGNLAELINHRYLVKKEDAGTDYTTEATLKVIDNKSTTATVVELAQTEPLYFANSVEAAKKKFKATVTVDGEEVKTFAPGTIHLYAESDNAINLKDEIDTDAKLLKVSANKAIYARIEGVRYSTLPTASSNMAGLKVTIAKRPIKLNVPEVKADRNADEDKKVKKVEADELTGTVSQDGTNDALAADVETSYKGKKLVSLSQLSIDLSAVDFTKPGDYYPTYTDLAISSNLAENYVLEGGKVKYHINRKYSVYYILEYNGEKTVMREDFTGEGTEKQPIKFYPKKVVGKGDAKKLLSFNGAITNKDNVVTNFKVYNGSYISKGDLLSIAGGTTALENIDYDATTNIGEDDYYLFAVVTAYATKGDTNGVMVESIPPVYYNTAAHIGTYNSDSKKASASVKKDLDIVIYDTTKELEDGDSRYGVDGEEVVIGTKHYYRLQPGTDFTISYKNNKNASVYFDASTSGNGMDGSVHQINTDKKKWPQVTIKGKGNYKGMAPVIYFDIYPVNIDTGYYGDYPWISGASHTVADHYIVKKGKITYKNKVTNEITFNNGKKTTTKVQTLKAAKLNTKTGLYTGDYLETFYVNNKTAGGVDKWEVIPDIKKVTFDTSKEYQVELKGVNNYTGLVDGARIPITVVDGAEFSKLKFKALKPEWKEAGVKPSELVEVKNGKTSLTAGEDKDFTIRYSGTDNYITDDAPIMNAGKYTLVITPTAEYSKKNKVYGEKRIDVTVKGITLKPTDVLVNGQKALKLEHTYKSDEIKLSLASSKKYSDELVKKYIKLENASFRDEDDENSFNVPDNSAVIGGYTWATSEVIANALYRHDYVLSDTGNKHAGSYEVDVYLTGPFVSNDKNAQHVVTTSYTRLAPDLAKAVKAGTIKFEAVSANANINNTTTDVRYFYKVDGKWVLKASTVTDEINEGAINIADLFDLTFKGVKAGKQAGTVTVAAKKKGNASTLYKGKTTVKFDINMLSVNEIKPFEAESVSPDNAGKVFAAIEDVISPNKAGASPKAPKVTLYQINEAGTAYKALKANTDYKATFSVKSGFMGNTVSVDEVTAAKGGYKGSFIFNGKDKALQAGTYNAYIAKANKNNFDFTVSTASVEGSKIAKDAKGNVTATYTGNAVKPKLDSVTIAGKSYKVNADGYTTVSDNVIVTFSNNTKVGTAKMTVTLKRGTDGYPVGGSKTINFKIVPQTDQNLVLSLTEKK